MQLITGPDIEKRTEGLANFFKMRQKFTPDLRELNLKHRHLVFFPDKIGQALGGMKNYIKNPRTDYLGGGVSVADNFQNRITPTGIQEETYLAMAGDKVKTTKGHVRGYVVSMPVSMICQLDMSYNRGYQTHRHRRHFWLTAQDKIVSVPCFVWTYKQDYLDTMGANMVKTHATIYNGKSVSQLNGKIVIL